MLLRNRRTIRLKEYNYAQTGAYFVTVCVQERKCFFGNIINGQIILNGAGRMIENNWHNLSQRFANIELDEFIIMPNHLHGVIKIIVGAPLVGAQKKDNMVAENNVGAGTRPAPTLGDMIGVFKSITTNEYIRNVKNNDWQPFNKRLWQRNFYEHIIRDENDLNRVREYIITNPAKWEEDKYYLS